MNKQIRKKTVIQKSPPQPHYPVSLQQEGIWLQTALNPGDRIWNTSHSYRYEGDLDSEALKKTVETLVKRHASMRTRFITMEDKIRQCVKPVEQVRISDYFIYDDLSYLPAAERETAARAIEKEEARFAYEIAAGLLVRFRLLRIFDRDHLLIVSKHHIISDVTSRLLIRRELIRLYNAYSTGRDNPLEPVTIQYHDYAQWQREFVESPEYQAQKQYWVKRLSGPLPVTAPPAAHRETTDSQGKVDQCEIRLEPGKSAALRLFALRKRIAASSVFLSAFYVLLNRYCGQEDMIIGTMFRGRNTDKKNLEKIAGLFANRLALRLDPEVQPNTTLQELTREVHMLTWEGYRNQDYLYEDLVRTLRVSTEDLFRVVFNMIKAPRKELKMEGLTPKPWREARTDTNFSSLYDLSLFVRDDTEEITIALIYSQALYQKETVERMLGQYRNILNEILKRPDHLLSELEILTQEEKEQLLHHFNRTAALYPREKTIHGLIEDQAQRTPHSIALVGRGFQPFFPTRNGARRTQEAIRGPGSAMTYRELNRRAGTIAGILRKSGVTRSSIVALMVERSLEMPAALLAVLKSGAAYLPIDPLYPSARIDYMLRDSSTTFLLTSQALEKKITFKGKVLYLEEMQPNPTTPHREIPEPGPRNSSRDAAYVIYTSGSTGKPKGVAIPHCAVGNFICGMTRLIDFSPGKTILALTTISFDIFVLETLLPWSTGLRVVLADEAASREPRQLEAEVIDNRVEMIQATPSRMAMFFLDTTHATCLGALKEIIIGGEPFPPRLLRDLFETTNAHIYNVFGPTETTVWSTVKELKPGEPAITIGRPISNTQVYILDKGHRLQPAGVAGEMYLGGDGLALGYLNNPELTAEKFIPNPFIQNRSKTGVVYRTGDLAAWLPGGELRFLGRSDNQVKIRGYRIELGEIETLLSRHKQIREAVVLPQEENDGIKSLCAYIVTDDIVADEKITLKELREYLGKTLPDYMIPSLFVPVAEIPLTANGKVDKKTLAAMEKKTGNLTASDNYRPPTNDMEEQMVTLWGELLKIRRIGLGDNFFRLGGHSLRAMSLIERIRRQMGIDISLSEVFDNPTIETMVELILKRDEKIKKIERILAEVEGLSDQQIKKILS
ncbi:MAG: amino acid adenylation domain-containing protein [bacterium]|nr:amino acid adenylation domain-containing protein [bacterium]